MCDHETAIVLDEWGAVSVLRCTWECGIVYFTTTDKSGLTYQVSYEQALGMQPKREEVTTDICYGCGRLNKLQCGCNEVENG